MAALLTGGVACAAPPTNRPQESGLATAVATLRPAGGPVTTPPPAFPTAAGPTPTSLLDAVSRAPTRVPQPTRANPGIPTEAQVTAVTVQIGVAAGATTVVETLPFPEVPRVTVDEARALVAAGRAVIADIRAPVEYEKQRIKGAVLLATGSARGPVETYPKDATLILYCA